MWRPTYCGWHHLLGWSPDCENRRKLGIRCHCSLLPDWVQRDQLLRLLFLLTLCTMVDCTLQLGTRVTLPRLKLHSNRGRKKMPLLLLFFLECPGPSSHQGEEKPCWNFHWQTSESVSQCEDNGHFHNIIFSENTFIILLCGGLEIVCWIYSQALRQLYCKWCLIYVFSHLKWKKLNLIKYSIISRFVAPWGGFQA